MSEELTMSTPIEEAPKPGYLTSEFWSMNLVHALAVATTLLDLLHVHWSHGLSGAQAVVPLVALGISACLQAAYHDKRVALKMDHTAQLARTYAAELEHGYETYVPEVQKVAQAVAGNTAAYSVLTTVAPQLTPAVAEAEKVAEEVVDDTEAAVVAWHGDMRDVASGDDTTAG